MTPLTLIRGGHALNISMRSPEPEGEPFRPSRQLLPASAQVPAPCSAVGEPHKAGRRRRTMKSNLSESAIVRMLAEQLSQRITRSTIRGLQDMDAKLSGDDSELEDPWDEICAQVQYEKSICWDVYEETIQVFVAGEVEALEPFEREAIWLQTPEGDDWACDDEESREPYPVVNDDIVAYIISDHVLAAAGRWTNPKIRAYIDRSSLRD